jgi:hypothetical protein
MHATVHVPTIAKLYCTYSYCIDTCQIHAENLQIKLGKGSRFVSSKPTLTLCLPGPSKPFLRFPFETQIDDIESWENCFILNNIPIGKLFNGKLNVLFE